MKISYKDMMYGRNGLDKLNRALLMLAALVAALQFLYTFATGRTGAMYGVCVGLVVVAAFRFFSRNLTRRGAENMMYSQLVESVKQRRAYSKASRQSRASKPYVVHKDKPRTKVVVCNTCGQKLRIPKGKGKIRVHCSKCGNVFEQKS